MTDAAVPTLSPAIPVAAPDGRDRTARFRLDGMTCASCVLRAERVLLAQAGVTDDVTYVSTAGGAFLEWMEGRVLPGVAALEA